MQVTTMNSIRSIVFLGKPWSIRSLVCLVGVLALCGSCKDSDNDRYSIRLEGDATMFNNAKARVVVFGIDSRIADAGATLIDENILPITDLPEMFELNWPQDAHTLIRNPSVTDPSNALYKFYLTIDVDGDGMMCQGDLLQDYDASPSSSFSDRPTNTTTIVMTEQEIDFCRQFSLNVPVEL